MLTINKAPFTQGFGTIIRGQEGDRLLDLDRDAVMAMFKASHFIFFQGFDVDTDTFTAFTGKLSQEFISYAGGAYSREKIDGNDTLLSVTGNDLYRVPAHGEMYYVDTRPDLVWFYCANPAEDGGETTVHDAAQVYEELSEETKTLLHSQPLHYIRNYPHGFWQKIYQTDDLAVVEESCRESGLRLTVNSDQSITTEYVKSAFVKTDEGDRHCFLNNILPVTEIERLGLTYNIIRLEDGSSIPEPVIRDIETVTQRLAIPIPWQRGDIAMVDNSRILHGRRPFEDKNRKIYVRLAKILQETQSGTQNEVYN